MAESAQKTFPDRAILVVARYPVWSAFAGLLSMAVFHLPLWSDRRIGFYKLMGCGRNGTFDIWPAWTQWALLVFIPSDRLIEEPDPHRFLRGNLGGFISGWWRFFGVRHRRFLLEPVSGHGTWDGRAYMGTSTADGEGPMAVLTRASIRPSRLWHFWSSVTEAARSLADHPGLVYSVGIGEVPLLRQATFSIWRSLAEMKAYAYGAPAHREAIRKTQQLNWYSEEMFLRFRVLQVAQD